MNGIKRPKLTHKWYQNNKTDISTIYQINPIFRDSVVACVEVTKSKQEAFNQKNC